MNEFDQERYLLLGAASISPLVVKYNLVRRASLLQDNKPTYKLRHNEGAKFIEVAAPPPKELDRCFLVGRCSDCGKVHGYKIDPNWVAYPHDIDWSEDKRSH